MKTTQMMMESLYKREKEYEQKRAANRRRLSAAATVAAAILLITAIPVGSFLIANRAGQPADTSDIGTQLQETRGAVSTKAEDAKTELTNIPEKIIITNLTERVDTGSQNGGGEIFPEGEIHLNLQLDEIGKDRIRLGAEATACHIFEYDARNYQIDIIVTDGENELYHLTINDEKFKKSDGYNDTYVDYTFDMSVRTDIRYCEVYYYFNVLSNDTESIAEYDKNPHSKLNGYFIYDADYKCFYSDTERHLYSWNNDRGAAENYYENTVLPGRIYETVCQLYYINQSLARGYTVPSLDYSQRDLMIERLAAFKNNKPEAYERLIEEFKSRQPKVYDRYGNLREETDYWNLLHDPLEDVNK